MKVIKKSLVLAGAVLLTGHALQCTKPTSVKTLKIKNYELKIKWRLQLQNQTKAN